MQKKPNFKNIIKLWMMGLIILGIAMRLYQFGRIPVGLNRDEAALGYNAYTIAHYGRDEWNRIHPYIFESFGDDKLPGYIYTLAPIIYVLKVHDWVIRLPSLIAGLMLIYLTYKIIRDITHSNLAGWLAAALLAINPWAIFYSRTAFEAHLALCFLVATIWFIIKPFSIQNSILATLFYLLAGLTYNSPLLLLPIICIFSLSLPKDTIKLRFLGLVPLILVALGLILSLRPLISQKQNITIFTDPTIKQQINQNYAQAQNSLGKILASKYTVWLNISGVNILNSMAPKFLVIRGGSHPWHSIPNTGQIYWITYILFWLGVLLVILKKVTYWRYGLSLLILTLGALVPAIVTVDAPHATRSLLFMWGIIGIAALTAVRLKDKIFMLILAGLTLESLIYAYKYFVVFPNLTYKPYPIGWEKISKQLETESAPVAITTASKINTAILNDQPYIWLLLYGGVNPQTYMQSRVMPGRDAAGMVLISQFDKYRIYNNPEDVPQGMRRIIKDENNVYRLQ